MGRGVLLLVLAAVAAGALVWAIGSLPRRRAAENFASTVDFASIVEGALPAGVPAALTAGSADEVRFWRRPYIERSYRLRAGLDSAQAAAFLVAVRDSIERRLDALKATRRGVRTTAWPGEGLATDASSPIALTIPYATRRRVGWVTLRAERYTVGGVVMWVLVHEGPKPTD